MDQVEHEVRQWLEEVVIGLRLCPFAVAPWQQGRVRIRISDARGESALLQALYSELLLIDQEPAADLETTLLVAPLILQQFEDYNQFLDLVDGLLRQSGWEGRYQVASFHPRYCFAGNQPDDAANLTNRSPYPILHIIRESSIEDALRTFDNSEAIPANNIRRLECLGANERRRLFFYLLR